MARKPTDIVAVTLRIREGLRRKLERHAKSNGQSLNAEMEARLEASFELANTESLIRVLVGGGFTADLLAAIARAMEIGGGDAKERQPEKWEALYIALILIFTELFSLPDRPLDPAAAGEVMAVKRGRGRLEASISQMEGTLIADAVLRKSSSQHMSLIEEGATVGEGGILIFPKRKKKVAEKGDTK